MSGYEVEHNITAQDGGSKRPSRRPDMSTFFSTLELVDRSDPEAHRNANAVPQPENMIATFRLAANAYQAMQQDQGDDAEQDNSLLVEMIQTMMQNADNPPTELKGVSQSFLDELDRVPKKSLKKSDVCPICLNPFLDDEYPLVVQLHKNHRFDMACIAPWLKLHGTCPLDRESFVKKKTPPPPPVDDDEEEYDDMYA